MIFQKQTDRKRVMLKNEMDDCRDVQGHLRENGTERKGILLKTVGLQLIGILFAGILFFGPGLEAKASSISELQKQIAAHQKELQAANDKVSDLKDAQSLIQELIDDLNSEIINTLTEISLKEDEILEKEADIAEKEGQIRDKQSDIDETEQQYYEAKAKEEQQKDDMVVRTRRIYETGTSSFLNLILRGTGLGNLLNRLDYAEQLYHYDKDKLSDYEAMRQLVHDLWDKLENEKTQLEEQKTQYEVDKEQLELAKQELDSQKAELDRALEVRKKESANYDAEIKKARQEASVAKTLIQQEQKELKKLQDAQNKGNTPAANATYTETSYTSIIDNAAGSDLGKKIAKYGCQYIGNPYVYGGTSLTKGTDCSGFTWRIYSDFGYSITRTSLSQRKDGTEVSYANAQPGDIICYSGHVALYIGGGKIVHASNQKDGIKVSNATYRSILTVRRIIQ